MNININEINNNFCLKNEREKEAVVLSRLLSKNGNCLMNGYLGSRNIKLSFDGAGVLEFKTVNEDDGFVVESQGAVLSNSVLIKQTQKSDSTNYSQIFSWDVDSNSYTYLAFDNSESMNECYKKVKLFDIDLNRVDISSTFTELGISFASVAQVLLDQKVDTAQSLVDEVVSCANADSASFVL